MEADGLEAIRAAQRSQAGEGGANDDGKAQEVDQAKREIIASVLEPDARERLARIALVNPTLSSKMEQILVRMAQSGQLRARVTENQLIGLLDQAEGVQTKGTAKKGGIIYQRRTDFDDDDDF